MFLQCLAGAGAALLLLTAPIVHADGVSCLVMETGLGRESRKTADSGLWESGLMSAFFEAGYVVTNFPALRLEEKPAGDLSGEALESLERAAAGGMEYLVIARLDYGTENGRTALRAVSLSLFTTSPQEKIFERTVSGVRDFSKKEVVRCIRDTAESVVSHIRGQRKDV